MSVPQRSELSYSSAPKLALRHLWLTLGALLLGLFCASASALGVWEPIRILLFSKVADGAFRHDSITPGAKMIGAIADMRGWALDDTVDAGVFTLENLRQYNVVVFNNTAGDVLDRHQQAAFEEYIRAGGGFVGMHAASDTEYDWPWYGQLVGARFKHHPSGTQEATVVVENDWHGASKYLIAPGMPKNYIYTPGKVIDEWYDFQANPRYTPGTTVLLRVDEETYSGGAMGGDHPIAWAREYDGGRAFYTALGHNIPGDLNGDSSLFLYTHPFLASHLAGGIEWAAGPRSVHSGLILDLNADKGLTLEENNRVAAWQNQVAGFIARDFVKRDEGRETPGSGRPTLRRAVSELSGHNSLIFIRQELLNMEEDAFDHLTQGSGYTWFAVMTPYSQSEGVKDVNILFGNLRTGGLFEGFWAGLEDNNRFWLGSRNGVTFGRFDRNNPRVAGPILEKNRYYIVAGRMGGGTGEVTVELFVDQATPFASATVQITEGGNPSKMAIGQERDATNHPGAESFEGELARLLIYERPLSDDEMARMIALLRDEYLAP